MSSRGAFVAGWVLALLAMAAFASLGRWQLARMEQKQAMLDAAAATLQARQARPLSVAADPARALSLDWAAGTGEFLPGPAVLLDNQQRDGRPGVRVYRAFDPVGAPPLLVELGWLPVPADRSMPASPPIDGRQRLQGLLAPPPSAGLADAPPESTARGDLLVIRLDGTALAGPLGVETLPPRVLRLDPELELGHPRDLDVLPNTLPPDKHLGYAVQWFGLALAVLVTALILTFRRPRR